MIGKLHSLSNILLGVFFSYVLSRIWKFKKKVYTKLISLSWGVSNSLRMLYSRPTSVPGSIKITWELKDHIVNMQDFEIAVDDEVKHAQRAHTLAWRDEN